MEPDCSGWATKNGLLCSDGRTIMPNAFHQQDKTKVPVVWQHNHNSPTNVLGHAILENRPEGVYSYIFFNNTEAAKHAKESIEHGDINSLSIWANQLMERSNKVLHGVIREVSLVMSGANPGALIDKITISHSDGEDVELDEAIITTGLELEHESMKHSNDADDEATDDNEGSDVSDETDDSEESDDNDEGDDSEDDDLSHADMGDGETVQDIYDSMNEKQKNVLHFMIGEALNSMEQSSMSHADGGEDETVEDVYNSMTDKQKSVLEFMVGEALASVEHSDINEDEAHTGNNAATGKKGDKEMKHSSNVFESDSDEGTGTVLTHEDMSGIFADAMNSGSLKKAVKSYALAHNIDNIDNLFPDAKLVTDEPEFLKRRTEWVDRLLSGVKRNPFSRIKSMSADLTYEDARAKGYVKGSLKREEFIPIATRSTTPTTVYKKQKLDRDDVVDITDFDVVVWLKGEMRIMLDEELARAILVGDGRDPAHDDKISETNIRPIAGDHELYTTTVNVNIGDSNSSIMEVSDAIIQNRKHYRGTGLPVFFTTETYLGMWLVLKDTTGRRIYESLAQLATELRVSEIVAVEVMEDEAYSDILGIMVNPIDYSMGTDRGGEVTMFDDFDLDYNKLIYLIETRASGALTKLKSAIVIKVVDEVLVTPGAPTFVSSTGVVTIPTQAGVVYKNQAGTTLSAGPMSAIAAGATVTINSVPDTGYAFNNNAEDSWSFTREP